MRVRKLDIYILLFVFWTYALKGILLPGITGSLLAAGCDILIFGRVFSMWFYIQDKKIKIFVFLFFLIFFITFILTSRNIGFLMQLNGFRSILYFPIYILYISFIFKSGWKDSFIKIFNKHLFYFVLLQTPVAIYQYFHAYTVDDVGGTFGYGGSGLDTLSISVIVFYLLLNKESEKIKIIQLKKIWLFLFFIPFAINEAKIAFFIIPLIFILSINMNRRAIFSSLFLLVFFVFSFNTLTSMFGKYTRQDMSNVLTYRYLEDYYFSPGDANRNRGSKLYYVYQEISKSTEFLLFGEGYGLFKGNDVMQKNAFTKRAFNLNSKSGNTSLSSFLAQGGMSLVILYFIFTLTHFRRNISVKKKSMKRFAYFFYFIEFITWFYLDLFSSVFFCILLAFFYNYIQYNAVQFQKTSAH